jgi:D-tyrosyl-tRNA(Tyr) deacylase
MKTVIQRVNHARVRVDGELVAAIGPGLLALWCVMRGDTDEHALRLADKVADWRCFPEPDPLRIGAIGSGRMQVSVLERGFELLVVSQVTLAADGRKGRRPALDAAASPADGERLYLRAVERLRERGLRVQTGRYGALMEVELLNHGPLTFVLDEPPQVLT